MSYYFKEKSPTFWGRISDENVNCQHFEDLENVRIRFQITSCGLDGLKLTMRIHLPERTESPIFFVLAAELIEWGIVSIVKRVKRYDDSRNSNAHQLFHEQRQTHRIKATTETIPNQFKCFKSRRFLCCKRASWPPPSSYTLFRGSFWNSVSYILWINKFFKTTFEYTSMGSAVINVKQTYAPSLASSSSALTLSTHKRIGRIPSAESPVTQTS